MDDILVPMTRGNMEDIENEGAGEGIEYSSGLDTMVICTFVSLVTCPCVYVCVLEEDKNKC